LHSSRDRLPIGLQAPEKVIAVHPAHLTAARPIGRPFQGDQMNPLKKVLLGSAMAGTALVGGAVGATLIGTANAQTPTTSSTTAPSSSTAPADGHDGHGNGGPHQANGITEAPLTGSDLTKATDAAKAAVPGATVERAETDAEGAAYEVHMTKSDGSRVTVKLDSSFKVASTVDGMG
jgi:hypothetical protein